MDTPSSPNHRNNQPFIIWTLRRTGGTNLAQALFERSPYPGVQHEPFNQDRVFGQITRDWLETHDEQAMRNALSAICERGSLIKHCVENLPPELNRILAEVSTRAGYQHVFLYRRHPLGRLLSLHFAQVFGVWGKEQVAQKAISDTLFATPIPVGKLIQHERHCRQQLDNVFALLKQYGSIPSVIVFEDIYTNSVREEASQMLARLLDRLKLSDFDEDAALFDRLLGNGGQGTRSSYDQFVNYDEFARKVEQLGDFDVLAQQAMKVEMHLETLPASIHYAEAWTPVRDPLSGTFTISGVVVLQPEQSNDLTLFVEIGTDKVEVPWFLNSPRMAERFPDNPNASKARFELPFVYLHSGRRGTLYLETPGADKLPIAQITT